MDQRDAKCSGREGHFRIWTMVLGASVLAAPAALAQEGMALSVDNRAVIQSDYRFRGFSYTDLQPTLKMESSISYSDIGGVHLGAIASSTTRIGGAQLGDTSFEIDYLVGYTRLFANFWLDATAVLYTFPGSDLKSGYEVYGSGGMSLGQADLELGFAYAPAQAFNELPFEQERLDNLYVWTGGQTTLVPDYVWTSARLGYETGAYLDFYSYESLDAVTSKLDWELGLQACDDGNRHYGLSYVDTSESGPLSAESLLASIRYGF